MLWQAEREVPCPWARTLRQAACSRLSNSHYYRHALARGKCAAVVMQQLRWPWALGCTKIRAAAGAGALQGPCPLLPCSAAHLRIPFDFDASKSGTLRRRAHQGQNLGQGSTLRDNVDSGQRWRW